MGCRSDEPCSTGPARKIPGRDMPDIRHSSHSVLARGIQDSKAVTKCESLTDYSSEFARGTSELLRFCGCVAARAAALFAALVELKSIKRLRQFRSLHSSAARGAAKYAPGMALCRFKHQRGTADRPMNRSIAKRSHVGCKLLLKRLVLTPYAPTGALQASNSAVLIARGGHYSADPAVSL